MPLTKALYFTLVKFEVFLLYTEYKKYILYTVRFVHSKNTFYSPQLHHHIRKSSSVLPAI